MTRFLWFNSYRSQNTSEQQRQLGDIGAEDNGGGDIECSVDEVYLNDPGQDSLYYISLTLRAGISDAVPTPLRFFKYRDRIGSLS